MGGSSPVGLVSGVSGMEEVVLEERRFLGIVARRGGGVWEVETSTNLGSRGPPLSQTPWPHYVVFQGLSWPLTPLTSPLTVMDRLVRHSTIPQPYFQAVLGSLCLQLLPTPYR